MKTILARLKAILAGASAGIAAAIAATADGSGITANEWYTIAGAVIVATGLVHTVPNIPVTDPGETDNDAAVAELNKH